MTSDSALRVDTLPSVRLPAAFDRVRRDCERAWHASDVRALVPLFTNDGFVLQPGRTPTRGHAALERVSGGQGGGALRLRALAYAHADTVGYIIGAYGYAEVPGDEGKFTRTLRRGRSERWLIASDMDNGSRPPRPRRKRAADVLPTLSYRLSPVRHGHALQCEIGGYAVRAVERAPISPSSHHTNSLTADQRGHCAERARARQHPCCMSIPIVVVV